VRQSKISKVVVRSDEERKEVGKRLEDVVKRWKHKPGNKLVQKATKMPMEPIKETEENEDDDAK
jgi:hypothetical protein